MRKLLQVISIIMLLPLLATGCTKGTIKKTSNETPKVYFFDQTKSKVFSENLDESFLEIQTESEQIQFILDVLEKGPHDNNMSLSMKLPIKGVVKGIDINNTGHSLKITFYEKYNELTVQERIVLRNLLVLSLTELDFVSSIEFYIENEPLKNANGDVVGSIYPNYVVTKALDPNPKVTTKEITLYFSNKEGIGLVAEKRNIDINSSASLERYIVEELIKGPMKEGLIATIPPETVVKDVSTKDEVCQVDLSFDLKSKFFATPTSKYMMIYSIVDSLTELSDVKKVAFLVDGKKDIQFTLDIDFKESFMRNEELIWDGEVVKEQNDELSETEAP